MILALSLFALGQSAPIADLLSPDRVAERVARCGLGRAKLRYDKELDETLVILRSRTSASDSQLACVDAAAPYFTVELSMALQWRFNAIRNARLTAFFKSKGQAWLSARGLIDRLPEYRPGEEAAFAHALEQLCGPDAHGAFRATGDGYSFSPSPEWMERQQSRGSDEGALACLTYAMMASGFPLGFVGNEAAQP